MRKPIFYTLLIIGLVACGAVVWYLASPLFINRTVDEDFPVTLPEPAELQDMSAQELEQLEEEFMTALPPAETIAGMPAPERQVLQDEAMKIATHMPEKVMQEHMPTAAITTSVAEPVLQLRGEFYGADDFHRGSGMALIYQLADGGYLLRLEDFEVINGPDLHVILAEDDRPYDHATLGDYLDLGELKGNLGDQNYAIPAGTDLTGYGSVVIYCVPFRAIFAIAPFETD
ncbi:MAG TPA: DM13 domain-containing protein [Anaerolineales bacterium]|nr:DM13 domain-containing protein [Anaerolineales bacterium]